MKESFAPIALAIAAVFVLAPTPSPAASGEAPAASATAAAAAEIAPKVDEGTNAACARCHAEVAREWGTSLHRASFRDESFQRGYALDPEAFCRGCHAPEAPREQEPDAWSADHGVACVTCHGHTEEEAHDRSARANASCVGCHEFAFPHATSGPPRRTFMQLTATEHRDSDHRDVACTTCHMPRTPDGHASHGFAASRDAELLRRSLEAFAVRSAPDVVDLTLTTRGVGHSFPTGDMFRRLLVRVEVLRADGRVIATRERRLERSFSLERGTKVAVADSRLAGSTSLRFTLGSLARDRRLRVRVFYQRLTAVPLAFTLVSRAPPRERLEGETLLAEHELVAP